MQKLHKLWQILLYAGATPEQYAQIFSDIHKNNHKRLQMFSGVTIAFLLLMVIITYADRSLGFRYQSYLIPMLLCMIILLTEVFFAGKHPRFCKLLIYVFISTLALIAINIGTVENREQTAGTFLAFLLVIPLLFVMRPIENICFITVFDVLFLFMSASVKERTLFEVDMINALVFGSISIIVSTFMMIVSVENFVVKHTLTLLTETDSLTGLKSRISYERQLQIYPTLCQKSLSCIYADANGLHELNEAKGHKAGDSMLIFVADALKEQFGDSHTYRIGGDEYVAFAVDIDTEAVKEKLKAFMEKVEQKGYYVSVGYKTQSVGSIDISALMKAAEEKMYLAKQQYYKRNPTARRRYLEFDSDQKESV